MKKVLLLLLVGTGSLLTAHGQSSGTGTTPITPSTPSSGSVLTPVEDQEVNKAHANALQADPSLATEERDLWSKLKAVRDAGSRPSPELMAELRDYNSKLRAAMVQADPHVEPALLKLEAAHPHAATQ